MTKELYRYNEPSKGDYESLTRNELENRLYAFILNLLENNFEKLCNMIYRHDVNESKFNNALELPGVDDQARKITDLVIDRELEKVKMRQAYKNYKDEQNHKILE